MVMGVAPRTVKPVQVTPVEQVAVVVADEDIEVPLPERRPPRVVEPVPPLPTPSALESVRVPMVADPSVAELALRAVVEAKVEKKAVVVAFVPVAFAKTKLPVRVVEERVAPVPKTRAPVPVSSVTRVASSEEVSMEVLPSLALNIVQSVLER